MQNPELSRTERRDFKVRKCDRLDVWRSPHFVDRWNLTIETSDDENGQLRFLGFNVDQMASLSVQIADALGRTPEITREQIKQCHEMLGRLLGASDVHGDSAGPSDVEPNSGW